MVSRALSLARLGRHDEAHRTLGDALNHADPESDEESYVFALWVYAGHAAGETDDTLLPLRPY